MNNAALIRVVLAVWLHVQSTVQLPPHRAKIFKVRQTGSAKDFCSDLRAAVLAAEDNGEEVDYELVSLHAIKASELSQAQKETLTLLPAAVG